MTDREIGEPNCILAGVVGSQLAGIAVGSSDTDLLGVAVEPPEYVMGLNQFEQWQFRDQPAGVRSTCDDTEGTFYALRKYVRLAVAGNPSILKLLFIPESLLTVSTPLGRDLQANSDMFHSRQAAKRFAGYMRSQLMQLKGQKQKHTNRPELIEIYGFDPKAAAQMVLMGLQGVEFLSTGRMTHPVTEPDRTWLVELRRGEHTLAEALERAEEYDAELIRLSESPDIPERPDMARVNAWMINTYRTWWAQRGLL